MTLWRLGRFLRGFSSLPLQLETISKLSRQKLRIKVSPSWLKLFELLHAVAQWWISHRIAAFQNFLAFYFSATTHKRKFSRLIAQKRKFLRLMMQKRKFSMAQKRKWVSIRRMIVQTWVSMHRTQCKLKKPKVKWEWKNVGILFHRFITLFCYAPPRDTLVPHFSLTILTTIDDHTRNAFIDNNLFKFHTITGVLTSLRRYWFVSKVQHPALRFNQGMRDHTRLSCTREKMKLLI